MRKERGEEKGFILFLFLILTMTEPVTKQLCSDLSQIVGEAGVLSIQQLGLYAVDDIPPKAVVFPDSIREIRDVLIYAAENALSVIPAGSGTKLGIGNPPERVDLVVSTKRLNAVLEYEPGDLTVTAQAGVRLCDLQDKLAENGQCLPLDPPYSSHATVGGIAAVNSSGPSSLSFGTSRNRVLGMQVVLSNGTDVKSGGKVVKNVAGYDLNKLYIGSFGTLGIISELTFKLNPLPEVQRTILVPFSSIAQASIVAVEIANSQLLPIFLNLIFGGVPSVETVDPCLVIGLDGHPETVEWQINRLQSIVNQNGASGVEVYDGVHQRNLRTSMSTFPERKPQTVMCKVNLRLTDAEKFITAALAHGDDLLDLRIMGHMGTGVVYVTFSVPSNDTAFAQFASSVIADLRDFACDVGGNLIVESAPQSIKQQIDIWGQIGSGLKLMKQIKAGLDPLNLLNPGRYVSGI